MGRGSSGLRSGGGSGATTAASTPSGISYSQFMGMSDDQKYDTMNSIISNPRITVPSYLDGSTTSKVMYALGMNNKPTVVPDNAIDKIKGKALYRTIYEGGSMPPPSTKDVADQIKTGDYTQLSGKGGSVHGRALYFADNFTSSATYGRGRQNPMMLRAKVNPGANIVDENDLFRRMNADTNFMAKHKNSGSADMRSLYALSHGIDGWHDPGTGYTMIVNRGALTVSSTNKTLISARYAATGRKATSWRTALDAT